MQSFFCFTLVNNSKVNKLFLHKIISIKRETNSNSLRLVCKERPSFLNTLHIEPFGWTPSNNFGWNLMKFRAGRMQSNIQSRELRKLIFQSVPFKARKIHKKTRNKEKMEKIVKVFYQLLKSLVFQFMVSSAFHSLMAKCFVRKCWLRTVPINYL